MHPGRHTRHSLRGTNTLIKRENNKRKRGRQGEEPGELRCPQEGEGEGAVADSATRATADGTLRGVGPRSAIG